MNLRNKCSFIIKQVKYNKNGLVSYFEMKSSCNITVMISVTVLLELFYVQLFLFFLSSGKMWLINNLISLI
jgi:hypothetical protein